MKQLVINKEVCDDCKKCEKIIYGFTTGHKGVLFISEANLTTSKVQKAIVDVRESCPLNAIKLEQC